MKTKKIFSLIICIAILATFCITASATSVTFGGTTSGGSLGTTNINGLIETHPSYAYSTGVGFNTPNPSGSFTLNVVGHLYVTRSPYGNNRIIDRTIDSWGCPPSLGSIGKYGAETNYPINGYMSQFYYQKAVVNVNYSSADHGSWNGSGQMNY